MSITSVTKDERASRLNPSTASLIGTVLGPAALLAMIVNPWLALAVLVVAAITLRRAIGDPRLAGWLIGSAVVSTVVVVGALFALVVYALSVGKLG